MEVIVLKEDGTYVHIVPGAAKVNTGGWELESTHDGQMVSLKGFETRPDLSGGVFYLLKPKRFFGRVRLMKNADQNEYYERERS